VGSAMLGVLSSLTPWSHCSRGRWGCSRCQTGAVLRMLVWRLRSPLTNLKLRSSALLLWLQRSLLPLRWLPLVPWSSPSLKL